jgi:hypothetical protein
MKLSSKRPFRGRESRTYRRPRLEQLEDRQAAGNLLSFTDAPLPGNGWFPLTTDLLDPVLTSDLASPGHEPLGGWLTAPEEFIAGTPSPAGPPVVALGARAPAGPAPASAAVRGALAPAGPQLTDDGAASWRDLVLGTALVSAGPHATPPTGLALAGSFGLATSADSSRDAALSIDRSIVGPQDDGISAVMNWVPASPVPMLPEESRLPENGSPAELPFRLTVPPAEAVPPGSESAAALAALNLPASAVPGSPPLSPAGVLAGRSLIFVENRGQWATPARFVAWNAAMALHLEQDAVALRLGGEQPASIRLTFEGASQDTTLVGEDRQSGYYNFFLGNDPARWHAQVAAYASVRYVGLYDGVDVRVRQADGQFAYDLLLDPGADLSRVVIRADGASGLELAADGSLTVHTPGGPLRQTAPVTWEVLPDGQTRPVAAAFHLMDDQHFGFVAPGRDPSLPLVVDPGLDWGTFFGGHGDDTFAGMALTSDGTGDIIIAGQTQSADFPNTSGLRVVHDYGTALTAGWTPYVARLNSTGTALVYATFFSGSGNHSVRDVAVNAAGEPVVVGDTNALDFPTTPGAYDTTPGNGSGDYDAYVIKFNAAGSGLVFGTYLAGSPGAGSEVGMHVAYDAAGSVIVSGTASSADFPTTAGAYPGQGGLFIARLNPTGTQLTYAARLGAGTPYAMTVDPRGFVTVTGQTASAAFPTTADAFQPTYQGNTDGFVSRLTLNGAGTADLRYSTYLGGAQYLESINAVAFDPSDPELVTVAGFTRSADFPTTPGAYQRVHPVPVDGSVATVTRFRFPAAGPGSLLWSTLFGAPGNQNATGVVIDSTGAAIIVGSTAVNNPPTTERAYDRIPGKGPNGQYDAFVARISSDGSRLLYSSLLGGSDGDVILAVAAAGGSSIIVGGLTNSPDFPVTPGAFDGVYAADGQTSGRATWGSLAFDVFIARFTLEANATTDVTPPPAPQLRWPADGATFTVPTLNVPFDWTDVADESGIAAYHVQLSPNPTFTNDLDAELRGWFEPWLPNSQLVWGVGVNNISTWYWRVQALDNAGNLGPWSEVRTLKAVDPPLSPAPALSSPANGGKFAPGDIVFAWQAVAGARYYQLQVDTRSDFSSSNRILISYLTQPQWKLTLPAGRYWWRVRLANDTSVGPWSSAWSLELKSGEPPAPVPPPPSSAAPPPLALSPSELWAAPSGELTVTLASPAPAGGAVVTLAAVFPENVIVPASVTVPAGSTRATVMVSDGPGKGSSGVIAEYAGVLAAASVYGIDADRSPELDSLTLADSAVIGGTTVQGTAALLPTWQAGARGAVVTLASGNPALASVPASVTIPAGANSVSFAIATQPVAAPTWLPIFASRSITLATRLTLLPVGSAVSALTLSPTSVSGGNSAQGTVALNFTAPAGGIVVTLASSNPAVAKVPASVTVPAGARSASFTVTTSAVAASTTVSITGSLAGTSQSGSLTVTAPSGPLAAPTLMFPSDKARFKPGETIIFDWSDVAGAASYTIQIDDSNTFSAPQIVNQTVTPSTFSTSTLPTAKMWWRVRANDAAGQPGAWSAIREIEVKS